MTGAPATNLAALNAWFTPKRFGLLLLLLLLAAFPDILLLGKSFFFRDYSFFSIPLATYQKECFWRGELPFWNGYHNLGHPFLAQWNTMALYPGSVIYLLLPLPWSLNLFCILHLFLAGMGMYFLARHLIASPAGAALAGIGYVFNAFMLNCLMYPHNIAALGWLPWILWGTVLACRHGGRALPLTMLTGAMQFLTGGAEIILQTWVLAGCLMLIDGWQHGWDWKAPARLVAIVVVVTALSAVQLLPFLDLLALSQRDQTWASNDWSMPAWGWLNLLVPKFASYPGPHGMYNQFGQAWINAYYPGCILVLLAAFAAWQTRSKLVLGGWLVILLSLAVAQGGEGILYDRIKGIFPQLSYIRYPVKFVAMSIVLLPLLAGAGLSAALTSPPPGNDRTVATRLFLLGFVLVFLAFLAARIDLYLQIPFVEWEKTLASGLVRVAVFSAAAFLIVRLRKILMTGPGFKWLLGLLALVWADHVVLNHRQSPSTKSWVYKPDLVLQEHFKSQVETGPGAPRFLPNAQIQNELSLTAFVVPEEQVAYCRMAVTDNLNLLDHLSEVHGFYPMDLKYFREILPWFHVTPDESVRPLIEFAGVAYTQQSGKPVEWYRKWNPQPFITAGQNPVALKEGDVLTLLAESQFHPGQEAYFYPADAEDLDDVVPGQATVESIDWREQSIRFKVNAAQPSIVVLAQTYHPAWVAKAGDIVIPLRRANHNFTALKVPPGTHAVSLVYVDRSFRLGLLVTAVASLIVGLLLFASIRTRKAAPTASEP